MPCLKRFNALREIRKQSRSGDLVAISAADPLNLTGVVTPDNACRASPVRRILYRDGIPIATARKVKSVFLNELNRKMNGRSGMRCCANPR